MTRLSATPLYSSSLIIYLRSSNMHIQSGVLYLTGAQSKENIASKDDPRTNAEWDIYSRNEAEENYVRRNSTGLPRSSKSIFSRGGPGGKYDEKRNPDHNRWAGRISRGFASRKFDETRFGVDRARVKHISRGTSERKFTKLAFFILLRSQLRCRIREHFLHRALV